MVESFELAVGYDKAYEIALTVFHLREGRERYRDGVVEAAARRGAKCSDPLYLADEITKTFRAYRLSVNPNWDGSIA